MKHTTEVSLGVRVTIATYKTTATITSTGDNDPFVLEFSAGTSKQEALEQILRRLNAPVSK